MQIMKKNIFKVNNISPNNVGIFLPFIDYEDEFRDCKIGDYLIATNTLKLYKVCDVRKTDKGFIINYDFIMTLKNPFVGNGVINTYYVERQIERKQEEEGCACWFGLIIFVTLISFIMWYLLR